MTLERPKSIETAWREILSKFPEQLQQEFRDERPNPNQEDIECFGSFRLLTPDPVSIPLEELLKTNEDNILRHPPDVIEEINKKWGTSFDASRSKVYDQNPDRVRKYSSMSAETARPSVMVDGEIIFGVGRFIAALLRKDSDLRVWELSAKQYGSIR
ncbi:MAG: hypothetical protein Q8L52_02170 [bacterium]|nr:hypothetical protein [bacterium]